MSKLIQNYQGSDKALLCRFEKNEAIIGMDVFEVPS